MEQVYFDAVKAAVAAGKIPLVRCKSHYDRDFAVGRLHIVGYTLAIKMRPGTQVSEQVQLVRSELLALLTALEAAAKPGWKIGAFDDVFAVITEVSRKPASPGFAGPDRAYAALPLDVSAIHSGVEVSLADELEAQAGSPAFSCPRYEVCADVGFAAVAKHDAETAWLFEIDQVYDAPAAQYMISIAMYNRILAADKKGRVAIFKEALAVLRNLPRANRGGANYSPAAAAAALIELEQKGLA